MDQAYIHVAAKDSDREDLETLKFTYGFVVKTVHGKQYVYFWKYQGTGRKTEQYMGPAGKVKTQRRMLQTELKYLKGLEQELCERIRKAREELEAMANTPDEEKPGYGKGRGRRTTAKDAVDGSIDGRRDQRDEEERAKT